MENFDSDLFLFQSYSDLYGATDSVQFGRRNGRVTPFFRPDWTIADPNGTTTPQEISDDFVDLICTNLTPLERSTWLQLLACSSVRKVARHQGVSRTAIYIRIHGTDGTGGMAAKNPWVAAWWERRQKHNK